jgi:hypothetical protein
MTKPVPLPTAETSFYTVRKVRGGWGVMLVTPIGSQALTTNLETWLDRDAAIERGRAVAACRQRPFKLRGA